MLTTQILGQHCADQREPIYGQRQPLATSLTCWGNHISYPTATGSGSSLRPTNSHVGTIWATKIKEGKEVSSPQKSFSCKTWILKYSILKLALPLIKICWSTIRLTLCPLLAMPRPRPKAWKNCHPNLSSRLPWPLWWGAGKEQPYAFREGSQEPLESEIVWESLLPCAKALRQSLHTASHSILPREFSFQGKISIVSSPI